MKGFSILVLHHKQKLILASVIAVIFVLVSGVLGIWRIQNNTIQELARYYKEVKAYHGIQTVYKTNKKGEKSMQSIREIWSDQQGKYYLKELEGLNQGIITVNNGQHKWQLNPKTKVVQLLPPKHSGFLFLFEIGNEINMIKTAKSIKAIDRVVVTGKKAERYQVMPDVGEIYCIWVDLENRLPIKKCTALKNDTAYEITYTQIECVKEIPLALLILEQPDGYTVRTNQTEQVVSCTEEAYGLVGVKTEMPILVPENYSLNQIVADISQRVVKFYYVGLISKGIAIIDIKNAVEDLKPNPLAILGTVNSSQAEILVHRGKTQAVLGTGLFAMEEVNSIRWQEEGLEYQVYGSIGIDILADFAEGISKGEVVFPETRQDIFKPEVAVEYDKQVEENEQKNVDAGHSPWKLDPVFVSQVFVSTIMNPEGIKGDYPIAYGDITITMNTGDAAIAKIYSEISPIRNVYLRKLIRQDETGIWTVVGYDRK